MRMANPISGLNKIFDNRIRLGVMSILMVNEEISFNDLKQMLEVTDGNLATHLVTLEEEGFIMDELNMLSTGHPQEEQLKTVLADHELMQMDNVIITPHMGAQTTEALRRILITSIDNIKNFVAGKPTNIVVKK